MLKKVRQTIFQIKALIIVLIVLIAVGWGLAIYFGLKAQTSIPATCEKRLEKLNSYAVLLDESTKLARQNKSFDVLEIDIRLLDNGSLLAEWEDVVWGGNQESDLNNYFDVIIDVLKFFSK
jgi:flagellar basal body-associated protein FliL